MRIIAGEFRGRILLPPEGQDTRPITDRAKQSLFDILAPIIPDSEVYDCFAGTGSLGLECLSRGAESVTFFESDRSAIQRLRRNIDALGVTGRCRLVASDLFRFFATAPPAAVNPIFLDPPYRFLRDRPDDLRTLALNFAQHHVAPEGLVIFRHSRADTLDLPPFRTIDQRTYGSMAIDLLQRA